MDDCIFVRVVYGWCYSIVLFGGPQYSNWHAWIPACVWATCTDSCVYVGYVNGSLRVRGLRARVPACTWVTCMDSCVYVGYVHGFLRVRGLRARVPACTWVTCMDSCVHVGYVHGFLRVCELGRWKAGRKQRS